MCYFRVFVEGSGEDVEASWGVKSHRTGFIGKELVRCLLGDDSRADLEVFQEVKEALLALLQDLLICLHCSTLQLVFEIDLVDVKQYLADISEKDADKLIILEDNMMICLRLLLLPTILLRGELLLGVRSIRLLNSHGLIFLPLSDLRG